MKYLLLAAMGVLTGCQLFGTEEEAHEASANIWGESGGLAYVEAAHKMISEFPQSNYLSEAEQDALSLVFSRDLLSQIVVHWDAKPLNQWASDKFGIEMIGEDAEAQAYGYHIYMRGRREQWPDERRLETLIHEITHSLQFRQYGGSLRDFGNAYFRAYYRGGQDYERNQFEIEANGKAAAWGPAVVQKYKERVR